MSSGNLQCPDTSHKNDLTHISCAEAEQPWSRGRARSPSDEGLELNWLSPAPSLPSPVP